MLLTAQQAVLLLLLLNILRRRRTDGGHGIEEIIERTFQHPTHHGWHRVENVAVSKKALHHGWPLGKEPLGVSQLFCAILTEVMLLCPAVDVAAVHKVRFISAAILAFHDSSLQEIVHGICFGVSALPGFLFL